MGILLYCSCKCQLGPPIGGKLSNNHQNCLFIAVPFAMARNWQQPKCPPIGDWFYPPWYICTVEYYVVVKREWGYFLWIELKDFQNGFWSEKKLNCKIICRACSHLYRKEEIVLYISICLCMHLKSLGECIGNIDMVTSLQRWDETGYIEDRDRKETLMYIYLFIYINPVNVLST